MGSGPADPGSNPGGAIIFKIKMVEFGEVFEQRKPVIGMIHLAGRDCEEKVDRALKAIMDIINEVRDLPVG